MNGTAITPNATAARRLSYAAWVGFEVTSLLTIAVTGYVLAMLARYSYAQLSSSRGVQGTVGANKDHHQHQNGSLRLASEHAKRRRSDGTGHGAGLLRALSLLAVLFAFMRVVIDQLELLTYGSKYRVDCKVYQVTVVVTYAASAICIYTVLWTRLRIFYQHPVMKQITSSFTKKLMWVALVAIVCSFVLNTMIFVIATPAVDSPDGCRLGTAIFHPTVRYVVLTVSTVGAQVLLLILFLFPLVKHRATMRKSMQAHKSSQGVGAVNVERGGTGRYSKCYESGDSDAGGVGGNNKPSGGDERRSQVQLRNKTERKKRLMTIMLRVTVTAIVCVLSDVVTAAIAIALNDQPRVAANLLFNFNLLINVFSVLTSFGDWRDRLAPFLQRAAPHATLRRPLSVTSGAGTPQVMNQRASYVYGARVLPGEWRYHGDAGCNDSQVSIGAADSSGSTTAPNSSNSQTTHVV